MYVYVYVDSEKIDQLSLNELKEMRKNLTAYVVRLHKEIEMDKKGR